MKQVLTSGRSFDDVFLESSMIGGNFLKRDITSPIKMSISPVGISHFIPFHAETPFFGVGA